MRNAVLIVDDASSCSATLEIALEQIPDLEIRRASNGRTALEVLESSPVAAVLTDLHMPQIDGFDLIRRIRANPELSGLPIIVLSGDSDPSTPDLVRELGASAYFTKPYSPAAVRAAVEQFLHLDSPR